MPISAVFLKCPGSAAVIAAALALAGCASTIAQEGIDDVARMTRDTVGAPIVWIRTDAEEANRKARTGALLANPLTADAAVELAVLNNRGLQASLAGLGVGAADLARARLPDPPGLTYSRRSRTDEIEIERAITLNVLGILTLPIRSGIEARTFEQTKLRVAQDIIRLGAETRRAYFQAVSAAQTAAVTEQMASATAARVDLAKRLVETGSWSTLNYLREQAFHAETMALRARVRMQALSARERLVRKLGLFGTHASFALPDRLPELPDAAAALPDIESQAIAERLDIRMAKENVDRLASFLNLTQATRLIDVLELGYGDTRETGKPRQTGYEIHLEVPIFDLGDAKVSRAEATYLQAVNDLAHIALEARSEARLAHAGYRTAFDLAQHYRREILPMRQRISEELVYRYNGMLVSVFELLADSREQVNGVIAAIEAERDYWIAETDLKFVLLTGTDTLPPGPSAQAAGAPAGH